MDGVTARFPCAGGSGERGGSNGRRCRSAAFASTRHWPGRSPLPPCRGGSCRRRPGEVLYEGRPLPLGPVAIRGSARPAGNSYLVEGVEIRSGSLGRLTGQAAFRGGNVSGRLDGERLPADNLVALAGALGGSDWNGVVSHGRDRFRRAAGPRGGRPPGGGHGHARGDRLPFPRRRYDGSDTWPGRSTSRRILLRRPRVNVDLALRRGEALWGTVYLDLAKDPLDLRVAGTRAGPGEYEELLLEGGSAGFGRLVIEGKARREGGTWRHQGRLALRDARLGPIFRTFLRDPLASSHPDLAGLEMEGAAEAALSFSGTGNAADLTGSLRLRVGDAAPGGGTAAPFRARRRPADLLLPRRRESGASRPLRCGKMGPSADGEGPPLRAGTGAPGSSGDPGPQLASTSGGRSTRRCSERTSTLRRIRADEPLSPDFRIRMAAELDGLDLSRIAGSAIRSRGASEASWIP